MTTARVLVVEDDPALCSVLSRGLREEGLAAETVPTGAGALEAAARGAPDLLVIDIGLPDTDGRDLCLALWARGVSVPVLFLTARDALVDRLSGFDAGGDDYLTKPFALDELVARLRALLRRGGPRGADEGRAGGAAAAPGVRLDPASHTIRTDGEEVPLTPTEFRILATLLGRTGQVVRRRELTRAGWPNGAIVHDNTLDAYIARLRRKLRALPGAPSLVTVHGVGYVTR